MQARRTWKAGKHFRKALGCSHVLQTTWLFWWGGWIVQKCKVYLIPHFWIIGKLEGDASPCHTHSPSFPKCLKAKALDAPKRGRVPCSRQVARRRPLLCPTLRDRPPGGHEVGCCGRRGEESNLKTSFPQLWQVLHFHALLKVKYESKTGTGKQVMSLKITLSSEQNVVPSSTLIQIPYGPMHLVWNSSMEI